MALFMHFSNYFVLLILTQPLGIWHLKCVCTALTSPLLTSSDSVLHCLISIKPMQMRPGERHLYNVCSSSFAAWATWLRTGGRGRSSHQNGNSPISDVTCSTKKKGEPRGADRGHQFHKTFPPFHLKARRNHVQGRCTMKWNGRPDPGERTQRRVHRNEGHSLPGDASVSRKGPAGHDQRVLRAALWCCYASNFNFSSRNRAGRFEKKKNLTGIIFAYITTATFRAVSPPSYVFLNKTSTGNKQRH